MLLSRNLLLTILMSLAPLAQAEIMQRFGDYEIHYIAFNSTTLTPEVAAQYELTRSGRQAIINISVLRKQPQGLPEAVPVRIEGTASNLLQQQQVLQFREVREGPAIYYLASLLHSNEELYRFRIRIQPEGATQAFDLKFEQKLYVESE